MHKCISCIFIHHHVFKRFLCLKSGDTYQDPDPTLDYNRIRFRLNFDLMIFFSFDTKIILFIYYHDISRLGSGTE